MIYLYLFLQSTEPLENHTTVWKWEFVKFPRALSSVLNVSVVLEEELVLDNLGDFVNAFIVLFLDYCMHSSWSKNKDLKG